MNESLLRVDNLHVTFHLKEGSVRAVRGASLEVNDRESLGIVGESGSGKSVTSLAIMRLIKEPPGEVRADRLLFEGRDVSKIRSRDMRSIRGKEISMIFQEPMTSFDPVFTIGQQLNETIMLHQGLSKRESTRIAREMLEKVRIPSPENTLKNYPHELSGGMRQRAMIAMALSCRPRILIADEPTTALDVTIQAQVLQLIKDLQAEFGMSLVMITHDLGVIAETTDRVVVMYGGKVLEVGTVFEIFKDTAQPYTRALLKSIPGVDDEKGKKLYAIPGNPPNPMNPPEGCPFNPRCPIVMDQCMKDFPPVKVLSPTHKACCWRLQ
jgi:oligopeptide/dipeptide ABC transporter ATP-binding protein